MIPLKHFFDSSKIPTSLMFNRYLICSLLCFLSLLIIIFITRNYSFCCDANYYLDTIEKYKNEGFDTKSIYTGYRAYLFPYLFSLIPFNLSEQLNIAGHVINVYYCFTVGLFIIIEYLMLCLIWGNKHFIIIYLSIFINPLILVYVPYPIQESFIVLTIALFFPLLLTSFRSNSWYLFTPLLGSLLGVLYMARPSHVLFTLPAILVLYFPLRHCNLQKKTIITILFLLPIFIFIAPQSLKMWRLYKTIKPYPNAQVLSLQLDGGTIYTKYGTNLSGSEQVGLAMPYWNPLACTSHSENDRSMRDFSCKSENIKYNNSITTENLFKILIHTFNAVNYDVLQPYITTKSPRLFSLSQLLSMAIFFIGMYSTVRKWYFRNYDGLDLLWDGILFFTLAVTALIAVETRFGLLATTVLSIRSIELFTEKISKQETFALVYSTILFLAATSLLSIYVLSYSGALSV